ncbi:zinc finger MYM-type protein 1-like [Corticium candelabrum]|uniref:zinc finger MYM-type protein 1-like n=1 Tax=Corticium candelabrum TaxID=121492 RepID=UPI002E265FCC|nr:zinc finger MYM-type protein 1-like [Corticium candelabrum]
MCDECTDSSNRELLVLCIRWIDHGNLEPQEYVIGMYQIDDISAHTIVSVIRDILVRMTFSLSRCRGQCCDGAANMKGGNTGVAKQLLDEEPRALYTYCYGHALNLAVGHAVKHCKEMKDALDTTYEFSELVKYSPKRDTALQKLKDSLAPDTPGFRTLRSTRWTVRADSLKSAIDNYCVLQEVWKMSKEYVSDSAIKGRIIGVQIQFKTFRNLFGVCFAQLIRRHSDNLSKTLQSPKPSAAEGQRIALMTVATLHVLRDDTQFDLFWKSF